MSTKDWFSIDFTLGKRYSDKPKTQKSKTTYRETASQCLCTIILYCACQALFFVPKINNLIYILLYIICEVKLMAPLRLSVNFYHRNKLILIGDLKKLGSCQNIVINV